MSSETVYSKLDGFWIFLIFISLSNGLTWTGPQMNSSSWAINITWGIRLEPDEYLLGISWQKNGKTIATYNTHDKFKAEPKYIDRLYQYGTYGLSIRNPTSEDNGRYTAYVVLRKDDNLKEQEDPHVLELFVLDNIKTVDTEINYRHGSHSSSANSLSKSGCLVILFTVIYMLIGESTKN